jgi:DNA-binding winged helix-turn-helix (wHTH) protein
VKLDLFQGFYLGDVYVDPRDGQIYGPAGSSHLPPKAIEVLLCLASTPQDLVTREHLIESVWGEGHGSHTHWAINMDIRSTCRRFPDEATVCL